MTLVHVDKCPNCGASLTEYAAVEPALLRAGGYGESKRTRRVVCSVCGWFGIRAVESVRP